MPPWVLPLLTQRVDTGSLGHEVDIALMEKLLDDSDLSFDDHLSVLACDTPHTSTNCRRRVVSHNNLVMVARIRGNRKVYSQPGADAGKKRFGEKMNLNKKGTHRQPAAEERFEITTPQGKRRIVVLKTWNEMLVRGHDGFRADEHPFTLVQVTILNSEGAEVYSKPLWLMAQGKRRGELSARQIFESYRQRFDTSTSSAQVSSTIFASASSACCWINLKPPIPNTRKVGGNWPYWLMFSFIWPKKPANTCLTTGNAICHSIREQRLFLRRATCSATSLAYSMKSARRRPHRKLEVSRSGARTCAEPVEAR